MEEPIPMIIMNPMVNDINKKEYTQKSKMSIFLAISCQVNDSSMFSLPASISLFLSSFSKTASDTLLSLFFTATSFLIKERDSCCDLR